MFRNLHEGFDDHAAEPLTEGFETRLFLPWSWRSTWQEPFPNWRDATPSLDAAKQAAWSRSERGLQQWIEELPALALAGPSVTVVITEQDAEEPLRSLAVPVLPTTVAAVISRVPRGGPYLWEPYHLWLADSVLIKPSGTEPYRRRAVTRGYFSSSSGKNPDGVRAVAKQIGSQQSS